MNLQERIDMWTDKVNFTNSRKKGVVAILAAFALLGGTPVPAQASSVQNTNIHKEYTHSRPLITGSIRGSALVLPRNHNNSGVRALASITNRTSNGGHISTTTTGWREYYGLVSSSDNGCEYRNDYRRIALGNCEHCR